MSVFADLPIELWRFVLQHIPLHERLSSCALVCQKFHAAAATECIDAILQGQRQVDSFMEYLQQYGSHLISITVTADEDDTDKWPELLEQLPCPQLLDLHLGTLDFKLDSDQDRPGLLSSTTALTCLELAHNTLTSGGLAALADLPHLQHLCVEHLQMPETDSPGADSAFAWATLQHLTHLSLTEVSVQAGSLRDISTMSSLRVLKAMGYDYHLLPSVAPGASLPPALQHFEFSGVLVPSVLAAATQLTYLNLDCARFEDEGAVSGGSFLLEWLPKLQRLEYLSLYDTEVDLPPPSTTFQPLVASWSKLRFLDIEACPGALAHTFPHSPSHDVVLTRLEMLRASDVPQEAVAQLVRCCPALVNLSIDPPGGEHLTALSQLSALTTLRLSLPEESLLPGGGGATSTAVSVQAVAGLTILQDLALWTTPHGTACQDLLPLTSLRQLTLLKFNGLTDQTLITNQAGPDKPPDVWLQLLEQCAADDTCQRSIMRNHAQQLAQQQRVNADLQQQVTDLQEQLAGQQQHNMALQEQLASQGVQLRALQAQLQGVLLQRLV